MRTIGTLRAIVAVLAVSACATGDIDLPPEVSLADLRPGQVGLFEQRVGVILRIRNPNDAALPIDGYRFALALNGRPFASGFSDQRVTVPRLGEAATEASAVVSTLDLLGQILAAPGRAGFEYTLTGTAFVDAAGGRKPVDFQQSGRFDPQP